jgi:hypothetical protein
MGGTGEASRRCARGAGGRGVEALAAGLISRGLNRLVAQRPAGPAGHSIIAVIDKGRDPFGLGDPGGQPEVRKMSDL